MCESAQLAIQSFKSLTNFFSNNIVKSIFRDDLDNIGVAEGLAQLRTGTTDFLFDFVN